MKTIICDIDGTLAEDDLVFMLRKYPDTCLKGRNRRPFFQIFRPTANQLDGYIPSSSINRIQENA